MLTVHDLHVRYGEAVHALRGVHIGLRPGSMTAVLGGNGAGKSTLLRAISGTLPLHRGAIHSGRIELDGRRIDRLDPAAIVRLGVVGVPEGRQIFGRMTVEENLRAGGISVRDSRRREAARRRVYELFPVLERRSGQRAGLLSGGEQQMLAIGRGLMASPRLMLLDEPSLGLAPQLVERIGEIAKEIHEQGTTVVLVEQNAAMALRVADDALVLETGAVAMSGPAQEFAASEDIRRLYLGGHTEATDWVVATGPVPSRWTG